MLQITPDATELLNEARRTEGVPETFGVRVYGELISEGQAQVHIAFAEGPEATDAVVEQQGTQLFVAPEVAEPLSDAFIDQEGGQLVIRSAKAG